MNQKNNLKIYSCIWIIAILILVFSLSQNFGYAKVINYSGIVRGATQKLIKKELFEQQDDELIVYLDDVLYDLQTGDGKYDLIKIHNNSYQKQLSDMSTMWTEIKFEIIKVRSGESKYKLYDLSEEYFTKANEMVATAQECSDHQLVLLIQIFIVYLMLTFGTFLFWNKYRKKQVEKAMYIDKLTGINNHAAFERDLKNKAAKLGYPFAVICLDRYR